MVRRRLGFGLVFCVFGCSTGAPDGFRTYIFAARSAGGPDTRVEITARRIWPTIREGIYGRVYVKPEWSDETGEWAVGLTIHAYRFLADGKWGDAVTVRTDADGFFQLALPPGRYLASPTDLRAVWSAGARGWEEVRQSGSPVEMIDVEADKATEWNICIARRL